MTNHAGEADRPDVPRDTERRPEWIPELKPLGESRDARMSFIQALYRGGDYDHALREIDRLPTGAARPQDALLIQARILYERGDLDAAEIFAGQAVKDNPQSGPAFLLLSLIHGKRERWPEAAETARLAVAADPDSDTALLQLGDSLGMLKDFRRSEAAYAAARARNPRLAAAHRQSAKILAARHRPDDAMASLRRAMELDPADANTREAMGDLCARGNRNEEAFRHYRLAASLRPTDVVYIKAARAALLAGRPMDAAIGFKRALIKNPRSAEAHLGLGHVHRLFHRPREAAWQFREALALDPHLKEASDALDVLSREADAPPQDTATP
jgi:tetratricopeptide (TPR) repeat protein